MSSQGPRGGVTGNTFASGRYAKAQCPVCGEVVAYSSLKKRWDGQFTCSRCLDPKHPAEMRRSFKDAIALHHPKTESNSYNPTFGFGLYATTYDAIGKVTVAIT